MNDDGWLNEWGMNEWVDAWVDAWVDECMNG